MRLDQRRHPWRLPSGPMLDEPVLHSCALDVGQDTRKSPRTHTQGGPALVGHQNWMVSLVPVFANAAEFHTRKQLTRHINQGLVTIGISALPRFE
ncbi:MAG: hypothetical protein CME13_01945 [Gemmatimonadetes bacterium]|nr:hypothetical protein [Gemmatimonadota bacterium]